MTRQEDPVLGLQRAAALDPTVEDFDGRTIIDEIMIETMGVVETSATAPEIETG